MPDVIQTLDFSFPCTSRSLTSDPTATRSVLLAATASSIASLGAGPRAKRPGCQLPRPMAGPLCVRGRPASAAGESGPGSLAQHDCSREILGPALTVRRKSFLRGVAPTRCGGAMNQLLGEAQSDGGPIGELAKTAAAASSRFVRHCAVGAPRRSRLTRHTFLPSRIISGSSDADEARNEP